VAFWVVAVEPSPKSQDQDVGKLDDVSVNVTASGASPDTGVPMNDATGVFEVIVTVPSITVVVLT
jgi:hypothetical protein